MMWSNQIIQQKQHREFRVQQPNENEVFLLDGLEFVSFFSVADEEVALSLLEDGGSAPKESPCIDVPPFFLSVVPNENPSSRADLIFLLLITRVLFPTPKVNPTLDAMPQSSPDGAAASAALIIATAKI
mmetsp:Transcript_27420/g.49454  ORF Transcript_27420/g.49454 Transcript_27420/m.49454 type:complete len:129 (+) Transcript_27420:1019-1405(+)